ncbi:hypothetical protein [Rossellomorea vietnamensis]|uniref:hypothetical protein n=1 Tax=Rossellomorea vietnamensis TaxID=218284 RepID=UPI001653A939|nr:hypothetical protein [Rossellomorea vietnamensis]
MMQYKNGLNSMNSIKIRGNAVKRSVTIAESHKQTTMQPESLTAIIKIPKIKNLCCPH